MEEEKMNLNYNLMSSFFPSSHPPVVDSDLDFSFTSTASTSTFASTSTSSARSSLSLSLPSFSPSTSLISPLPHSSSHNSPLWSALRAASTLSKDGSVHLRHLHLLRHLGSGHLAKVFHCRLKGSDSFDFALKVVDLNTLHPSSASNDHQQHDTRLSHVRTEARVLAALDHPFLPTLYARMDASHYACFLIDYCPGGDLHSLLLRHPGHRLPISVVRFFAAEVLVALEYLHALGFVYRDLKPENVLIRSDGHIMLSDFDLCFSSEVKPSLYRRKSRLRRRRRGSSCFGGDEGGREEDQEELMEFVAEPEGAFSRACVGTHEYLAPEIVSGNGHGNGVDWWAFGVFVYELMYGRTPFKGSTKEATLKNIMKKDQAVRFPDHPVGSTDQSASAARDLIRRLLVQEPKERLGSRRGAAEIKRHPFFEGVKWPLIRSTKSPVVVGPAGAVVVKEGKRGWWRRVNSKWRSIVVCYKKGIKLGLGSSTSSSNSSNNKRKGIRKE